MKQPNHGNKTVVGITHGDINGIGYEVIMKSLNDQRMMEMFTPVVYGLSKAASYHRKSLNMNDFNFNIIKDAGQADHNRPNIINIYNQEVRIELGSPSEKAGEMAYLSLEAALQDIKKNKIQVLVTAPINKKSIQSIDFNFPGHTEYLARRFEAEDYLMLMVSDQIKIGAITGHIPISDISSCLDQELILRKINTLHTSLIQDFAIAKPKIALLSLNPHASDRGLIGDEEMTIITPAIEKAYQEGKLVYGPFASDGFFGSNGYEEFDAILAMYHDQAMLPFKLLSFESGVNYTAGLPAVRTSPAHGTAFDIAGKNTASPESFRKAIYLAIDIYKNRMMYREINSNPLQSGSQEENDHPPNNSYN